MSWHVSCWPAATLAAAADFAESEIEQLDAIGRDHDVAGLDVAMRYACAMGAFECVGNLRRESNRLFERQRTFGEPNCERFAFEIFHD